ncbi:peptide chain release factor N(5)-glutamine methyltransferase [Flavobacteriaceae bacterium]|jgi:release factor glutamine methyltransferase|nr:peptide chain release factor N(5)-glutamine methyltransferase [Flavobacteriaceae bacterium]
MRLSEFRTHFQKTLLKIYSKEETDSIFKRLIAFYFEWDALYPVLNPNYILDFKASEKLKFALSELKKEKPLQYITHQASFFGMDFYVNESVLIPRQETEDLVSWILDDISQNKIKFPHLIDIGTGSGCIAISLIKANKEINVNAIDSSEEALTVAKKNAKKHQVKIDFIQQDIQSLFHWKTQLDVIVSNPPYIHPNEKKEISPNVLNYEPHLALFTPENDSLYYYKLIINFAASVLKPGGSLYFEINPKYLELLKSNFSNVTFGEIEVRNDIFGKSRMLKVTKN